VTIVNDASTINLIDDASLALVSIVNYDHKWRYNLERHFDDTRSVNYDRNTFIIQATGLFVVGEMASWQKGKLTKEHIDETS